MTTAREIHSVLEEIADPVIARHSQRFFRTGKGEYGEGDRFLGIRVPILRSYVRELKGISLTETLELFRSCFHEERFLALLLLVYKCQKGGECDREAVYRLYLDNLTFVNNWDLVDISAPCIIGGWLETRDKSPLYSLAQSMILWERRIAIMSTFHFIRHNSFEDALAISAFLKHDSEDLIHKAVGWMLREIGKREIAVEKAFLKEHYEKMPRTMLRYAIERFPENERRRYLKSQE